jgi:hypothetical protein
MTGQSLVASPDERPGHKQKLMERGAGKTALFFILLKPKRRGETRNPFYPLKLTCSTSTSYTISFFVSFSRLFFVLILMIISLDCFSQRAESLEDGLT